MTMTGMVKNDDEDNTEIMTTRRLLLRRNDDEEDTGQKKGRRSKRVGSGVETHSTHKNSITSTKLLTVQCRPMQPHRTKHN